jgi:hypothetical protein
MAEKKTLSAKTVEKMAERVALFKGRPWSWSEFNATKSNVRRHIAEEGATEKQLEEFDRIIEKAPIVGGSFNTWSGD